MVFSVTCLHSYYNGTIFPYEHGKDTQRQRDGVTTALLNTSYTFGGRCHNKKYEECQAIIIIIINKVLIKVTLNKVIAGALYTVSG